MEVPNSAIHYTFFAYAIASEIGNRNCAQSERVGARKLRRFANGLELAARTDAAELKPSTPGEAVPECFFWS